MPRALRALRGAAAAASSARAAGRKVRSPGLGAGGLHGDLPKGLRL